MVPEWLITALGTTAMVIGFCVMFAWLVGIVWLISTMVGEFRFNRILKKRAERDFDNLRSSWLLEMNNPYPHDGLEHRTDTVEFQAIHFKFAQEDYLDTEETGAVFDIRERYPHEFA